MIGNNRKYGPPSRFFPRGGDNGGGFIVFFSMPPGYSVRASLGLAMVIFAGKVYLLANKFK